MKLNKIAAATGIFLSLAVAAPSVAFARHGADDHAAMSAAATSRTTAPATSATAATTARGTARPRSLLLPLGEPGARLPRRALAAPGFRRAVRPGHGNANAGSHLARQEDVRVENVPDPSIEEPTDAIIRVTSTGDLRLRPAPLRAARAVHRRGRHPRARADGHRRGGRRRGRRTSAPGDRVVIPFNISCGHCWMCDAGSAAQCETTQVREHGTGAALFGYTKLYGQVPGGQAEFLRVPAGAVRPDQGPRRAARRALPLPVRRAADRVAGGRVRGHSRRAASLPCSGSARSARCAARIAQHRGAARDRRRPRARAARDGPPPRRRDDRPRASTTTSPSALRELHRRPRPDSVIDAVGMEAHGSPVGEARADGRSACCPTRSPRRSSRTSASTASTALHQAIDVVRRGGTVSISGVYGGTARPAADDAAVRQAAPDPRWARRTSSAGSTTSCRW